MRGEMVASTGSVLMYNCADVPSCAELCHGPAQVPLLPECVTGCLQTSLSYRCACCHFVVIERHNFRHNYLLFHLNSICYLKEIEEIGFDRLAKYSSRHAR